MSDETIVEQVLKHKSGLGDSLVLSLPGYSPNAITIELQNAMKKIKNHRALKSLTFMTLKLHKSCKIFLGILVSWRSSSTLTELLLRDVKCTMIDMRLFIKSLAHNESIKCLEIAAEKSAQSMYLLHEALLNRNQRGEASKLQVLRLSLGFQHYPTEEGSFDELIFMASKFISSEICPHLELHFLDQQYELFEKSMLSAIILRKGAGWSLRIGVGHQKSDCFAWLAESELGPVSIESFWSNDVSYDL